MLTQLRMAVNIKRQMNKKMCNKTSAYLWIYKDCLLNDKITLKSQQVFRSDCHEVYTEEINKIALSSKDHKRLKTFNKIATYPYGTNVFRVCESKMMTVRDYFVEKYGYCLFL